MLRAALLCLLVSPAAHATILVTIDPDQYSAGTDLSRAGPDAVLSTFINKGGSPRFDSVIALSALSELGASHAPYVGANLLGRVATAWRLQERLASDRMCPESIVVGMHR